MALARRLGLRTEAPETREGGGGSFEMSYANGVTLSVGGASLTDQRVAVAGVSPRGRQAVGGILGSPFFTRFAVTIDYDRGRLEMLEAERFDYRGTGDVISYELQGGIPLVRVPIVMPDGRRVEARLHVDTGASQTIILHRPFVEAHKLITAPERMLKREAGGLGGRISYLTGRVRSVRLGRFTFEDVPINFSQDLQGSGNSTAWDGVVGNGLLRRFRVIFDHRRTRLILEPGALVDVPYDYDLTGLTIVQNGAAFGIGSVAPGSIAASAGLHPGDIITALDGRPIAGMTLTALRSAFRQDGGTRVLTIERLGKVQEVSLAMTTVR